MRMRLAVVALVVLAAATVAIALERVPATQPGGGEAPAGTIPWARYACVLSALAAVGVIWVGWSMRALAKNQVELGRLILGALEQKG